jgi:hypothetical protein
LYTTCVCNGPLVEAPSNDVRFYTFQPSRKSGKM